MGCLEQDRKSEPFTVRGKKEVSEKKENGERKWLMVMQDARNIQREENGEKSVNEGENYIIYTWRGREEVACLLEGEEKCSLWGLCQWERDGRCETVLNR